MKRKTLKGVYRHYRRRSDGTLEFVGEVPYTHNVEPAQDFDTTLREYFGFSAKASRQAAEATAIRRHSAAEDFERLVDLAFETEG